MACHDALPLVENIGLPQATPAQPLPSATIQPRPESKTIPPHPLAMHNTSHAAAAIATVRAGRRRRARSAAGSLVVDVMPYP